LVESDGKRFRVQQQPGRAALRSVTSPPDAE